MHGEKYKNKARSTWWESNKARCRTSNFSSGDGNGTKTTKETIQSWNKQVSILDEPFCSEVRLICYFTPDFSPRKDACRVQSCSRMTAYINSLPAVSGLRRHRLLSPSWRFRAGCHTISRYQNNLQAQECTIMKDFLLPIDTLLLDSLVVRVASALILWRARHGSQWKHMKDLSVSWKTCVHYILPSHEVKSLESFHID